MVCGFFTVVQLQSREVVYILIGIFHLINKPYKRNWMNIVDRMVPILFGPLIMIIVYNFVSGHVGL